MQSEFGACFTLQPAAERTLIGTQTLAEHE